MRKFDFLLWGSLTAIAALYFIQIFYAQQISASLLGALAAGVAEIADTIWMSVLMGMVMVALLSQMPRQFVMSVLGDRAGFGGIMRAALGGVLLDLCNHGILMIGAKLYERGASAGQMMAFLIASPWNSFSLTLVLIALIGLSWTLMFILLSMLIAVITGLMFDGFVRRGILPDNPNKIALTADFRFWPEARAALRGADYGWALFKRMITDGFMESRMVLRWVFFGVVLAGAVRAFVPVEIFAAWFGPTLIGLLTTLIAATVIEVCSEGMTPLSADLLNRAHAPGNGFTFLMAGVATDYTEIMIVRAASSSWKIALFLPLIAVPQIMLLGWLMNSPIFS